MTRERWGRIPDMNAVQPVTVRYWAAAKAAAGVASDTVEPPADRGLSLADVLADVRRRHADRPRLDAVLGVCSVLLDEQPVGTADPADVPVRAGQTVDLLPPFAGG